MTDEFTDLIPNKENEFADLIPATALSKDPRTRGELKQAAGGFDKATSRAVRYDDDVDYVSGVNVPMFRAGFSRMDTDEERANYLSHMVGEENWGIDSGGRFLLFPEGLEKFGIDSQHVTAIDELAVTKSDFADWAGSAPAAVGAIGAGMMATGMGVLPGAALVGLGGAGGKAIDESIEALQGYNRQSSGEVAIDLAVEGGLAVGGEGIVRTARPFGRWLLAPSKKSNVMSTAPSWFRGAMQRTKQRLFNRVPEQVSRIDAERIVLTEKALDMGAVPSAMQASDRSILGRVQGMIDTIFGINKKRAAANYYAVRNRQSDFYNIVAEDLPANPALKLSGIIGNAQNAFEVAEKKVRQSLGRNIQKARQLFATDAPGGRDALRAAKQTFDDDMASLYGAIDDLVGGRKVVSTQPMKNMAQQILDLSPNTKSGGKAFLTPEARKSLADIVNLEDTITFKQAQRARTILRESADNPNILNSIGNRDLMRLKSSVDSSLDQAGDFMFHRTSKIVGKDGKPFIASVVIDDDLAKEAARQLKAAQQAYHKGITRFDDEMVRKISLDPGEPGSLNVGNVAKSIERIEPDRINNIRELMGPSWKHVLDEHLDSLITVLPDGSINPSATYQKIINMGDKFDVMYGDAAPGLKQLFLDAAEKNVDFTMTGRNWTSEMTASLQNRIVAQDNLDRLMKVKLMRAIKNGDVVDAEETVNLIWRGGKQRNPRLLSTVKKYLGEDSAEWGVIREKAMNDLLDGMWVETDDAVSTVINGKALDEAINFYGKRNMRLMFGEQLADELADYAKTVKFLASRGTNSGGIVAANIALHPVVNLPRLAWLNISGRMINTPGFIRYLTQGIKAPKTRIGMEALTRASVMAVMIVDDQLSTMYDPLDDVPELPEYITAPYKRTRGYRKQRQAD